MNELPKNVSLLEEREIPIYVKKELVRDNLPALIAAEVKRISLKDDGRHIAHVTAYYVIDHDFHGKELRRVLMHFHQCCGRGFFYELYEIRGTGCDCKLSKIG